MKDFFKSLIIITLPSLFFANCDSKEQNQEQRQEQVHVFEIKEVQLEAVGDYQNPYKEV